jgi:peptide chain release factor 1
VTDHRLSGDVKNFNLQPILNGDLDPLIDSLTTAEQAALLQAQTEA